MVLVCHMILQGHVVREPCDFIGTSSLRQVTILPSLVTIGTLIVEI